MLVAVTGTVKIGGILAVLQNMRRMDFRNVFKKLRRPMHRDQARHRDAQRGPVGPWAPLSPYTLALYARQGKRKNRRILARLPNARRTQVSADELLMFSPVKWSMIHQKGGINNRGNRIPQRQFFYVGPQLIAEAKAEFKKALLARWQGRRYP